MNKIRVHRTAIAIAVISLATARLLAQNTSVQQPRTNDAAAQATKDDTVPPVTFAGRVYANDGKPRAGVAVSLFVVTADGDTVWSGMDVTDSGTTTAACPTKRVEPKYAVTGCYAITFPGSTALRKSAGFGLVVPRQRISVENSWLERHRWIRQELPPPLKAEVVASLGPNSYHDIMLHYDPAPPIYTFLLLLPALVGLIAATLTLALSSTRQRADGTPIPRTAFSHFKVLPSGESEWSKGFERVVSGGAGGWLVISAFSWVAIWAAHRFKYPYPVEWLMATLLWVTVVSVLAVLWQMVSHWATAERSRPPRPPMQAGRGKKILMGYSLSGVVAWVVILVWFSAGFVLSDLRTIALFDPKIAVPVLVPVAAFLGVLVYATASLRDVLKPKNAEDQTQAIIELGNRAFIAPYVAVVAILTLFKGDFSGGTVPFIAFFTGLWIEPILNALKVVGDKFTMSPDRDGKDKEATPQPGAAARGGEATAAPVPAGETTAPAPDKAPVAAPAAGTCGMPHSTKLPDPRALETTSAEDKDKHL